MFKTVSIDLNKTLKTYKSDESIKMISFEIGLAQIIDKCISVLDQVSKPKDNSPEELNKAAQAKISILSVQNLLLDSKISGLVDATLKEIFYLSLTKITGTPSMATGYKILNKLNNDVTEFDINELRVLYKAVEAIKSQNEPTDELNIFAKMFAVGELREAISTLNPVEFFSEDSQKCLQENK